MERFVVAVGGNGVTKNGEIGDRGILSPLVYDLGRSAYQHEVYGNAALLLLGSVNVAG